MLSDKLIAEIRENLDSIAPFHRNCPCDQCFWFARIAGLLADRDELLAITEALRLILPMAKGYAAEHPVGGNQRYVKQAEDALNKREKPDD